MSIRDFVSLINHFFTSTEDFANSFTLENTALSGSSGGKAAAMYNLLRERLCEPMAEPNPRLPSDRTVDDGDSKKKIPKKHNSMKKQEDMRDQPNSAASSAQQGQVRQRDASKGKDSGNGKGNSKPKGYGRGKNNPANKSTSKSSGAVSTEY